MKKSKESPKKTKKEYNLDKSDKQAWFLSPFVFILFCTTLISSIAFGLQNKQNSSTKITSINSEFVNLNASSDSWSCPYLSSGETENLNSIVFYNPSDLTTKVTLQLFNIDGSLLNSKDFPLEPKASFSQLLSAYGKNLNVTALVESFGAPVIVYRDLKLSDGKEILPCSKNPKDVLEFDNLTTKRNTNTTLMLANPHDDSIVVDIKARLVDTSSTPYKVVLDDVRGVVISAFGRTDIDLQAAFGRYSLIDLTVITRSGFITGEALVDYKDEGIASGQTIVTSSLTNNLTSTSYAFGNSPLNIYGQSNTGTSTFVDVDSYGSENRILSEPGQSLTVGATMPIVDPGVEFGYHVVKLTSKQGKKVTNSEEDTRSELLQKNLSYNTFVAGNITKDTVSSYNASSLTSKSILLASTDTDNIAIYNTSKKTTKVTVTFISNSIIPQKTIELQANSFTSFSMNDLDIAPGTILLSIDSTQDIVVSSARSDFSGITNGVYLKK